MSVYLVSVLHFELLYTHLFSIDGVVTSPKVKHTGELWLYVKIRRKISKTAESMELSLVQEYMSSE